MKEISVNLKFSEEQDEEVRKDVIKKWGVFHTVEGTTFALGIQNDRLVWFEFPGVVDALFFTTREEARQTYESAINRDLPMLRQQV